MDEERDRHDLLVHIHAVLRPKIVLPKEKSVVCRHDQHGIAAEVTAVK
jgi:hypothetical protein